jgi:hypothetical protein
MVRFQPTGGKWLIIAVCLGVSFGCWSLPLPVDAADAPPVKITAEDVPLAKDAPGLTRLAKDYDLWLDMKAKRIYVDGEVVLREGQLELFACPKGSKEHESVIAVQAKPQFVHAGLLALGATPGTGVRFDPKYIPATGPIVDIYVAWKDDKGKQQLARAQEWVKNLKTDKEMDLNWVFAGSGFWKDPDTGRTHYHADVGDFICVSNFPTAMLDLPIDSPQTNANLLFAAFTERIPPKGTKVRLVLVPRLEKKEKAEPGAPKPGELKLIDPKAGE